MATGTLGRLAIAIGIDDSQVTTGILRTRTSVLSGLASIGAQAEAQSARTAAAIERSSTSSLTNVGGVATGVVAAIALVVGGLGTLAVKFESETSHIAAAANITSEQARKVGQDFLAVAGKSQQMIFSAQDMTDSYAAVAGQLALTDSRVNVYTQDMTFMQAAVNLAAGSNSSLSDSTAAVASVLQNFQLKIKDSAEVSNILFDASRGLNMSLGDTADTLEKLRGRLGTSGLSLKDTATLVEFMATHALTGQRNINLFAGAINQLLGKAADPTKLVAAQTALAKEQDKVTSAQQRYDTAVSNSGVSSAQHLIDMQKLQDAQSRYQATLAKYGPQTVQTQSALVAVETAQQRVTAENSKGSASVTSSAAALKTAQENYATAQAKVNSMMGTNNATLKALGVNIYDAKGNFIGMEKTIGLLHNAFAKLTPQQQQAAATQLFTSNAASAMIGIINDGTKAWDKYSANIGQADSAQTGALKSTDNLSSHFKAFVALVGAQVTQISLDMESPLKSLIDFGALVLPVIVTVFSAVLSTGMGIASFFGTILNAGIGPVHLWQLFGVVLAIFAARWILIKTLGIAKEISMWGVSLVRFLSDPGAKLLKWIGMGEKGSVTGGFKDVKAAWADAFQAGNFSSIKNLATDLETATQRLAGFNMQADTLKSLKVLGVDTTAAEASLTKLRSEAVTAVQKGAENLFAHGNVAEILTSDITKSVTDARVAGAINGVFENAQGVLKEALENGVKDAAPTITKDIADATAAGVKNIATDVTGKATDVVAKGASESNILAKSAAVLSKIPGLGKIAGLASAALAQPVFVVNWPGGFGPGGNLANSVEQGLAKDAAKTSITSSSSAKIVNAIKTAIGTGAVTEGATAATAAVTAEAATAVTVADAATVAAGGLTLAAVAVPAAIVAGLAGLGLTIAGLTGHGPLSMLGGAGSAIANFFTGGGPNTGDKSPFGAPSLKPPPSGTNVAIHPYAPPAGAVNPFQASQGVGAGFPGFGTVTVPTFADLTQMQRTLNNSQLQPGTVMQGGAITSSNPQAESSDIQQMIDQGRITTQSQLNAVVAGWEKVNSSTKGIFDRQNGLEEIIVGMNKPLWDASNRFSDMAQNGARIVGNLNGLDGHLSSGIAAGKDVSTSLGVMRTKTEDAADHTGQWTGDLYSALNSISDNVHGTGRAWLQTEGYINQTAANAKLIADHLANLDAQIAPFLVITHNKLGALRDDQGRTPGMVGYGGPSPTSTTGAGAASGRMITTPQTIMVGEGGESEWIIPRSKAGPYVPLLNAMLAGKIPVGAQYGARYSGMSAMADGPSMTTGRTTHVEHLEVYNPIPETASESVEKRLQRLSYTGLA